MFVPLYVIHLQAFVGIRVKHSDEYDLLFPRKFKLHLPRN